jgi:hypothetical protein
MGATYTRQSSSAIVDGGVIEASDINAEFDQVLAAFAVTSGHTHDGTAAEGGPITKLLGTAITIGDATAGTDISVTFDGETGDGVLTWMEDEDYFKFSDDILMNSTERLNFGDTGTYIFQSTDGQLDIVADTEVQIAATTIDINGAVDISGALTLAGTTLAETISDTVGAMVTSNTESGITVAYDDADNTLDFTVGTLNQDTTGTAATVTGAAQTNITSLGTLTALTVDNMVHNGDTITMTPSASDTATMTAATNGAFSLVTVDAAAAAANIQITADGTVDIDSAGVLTLDSEADINLEAAADVNVPVNIGLTFGDDGEKIEGNGTDLTINSSNDLHLTATTDINVPANVGMTFGDDGEKIEGNGTLLTISSSQNLVLDAANDLKLDSGGNIYVLDDGGIYGHILRSGTQAFKLRSHVSDADLILEGSDGGSVIAALTLDMSEAGAATFNNAITSGAVITSGAGVVVADAGTIGSASDVDAIAIGADGDITLTQDLELQHDGAILSFGANDEVTLTHVHNDGLLLNTDMQLQFRDSAINIRSDADGDLDINADDEVEINSTLIDINGNVEMSGTLAQAGVATFALAANVAQVALTSSSNAVAWNASAAANAYHLTTENTTFSAPSNPVEGAFICIEINYNGSHTIAFNTVFEFAASTAPTFTSTDAKTDILVFKYSGAVWQEVGRTLNLSEA